MPKHFIFVLWLVLLPLVVKSLDECEPFEYDCELDVTTKITVLDTCHINILDRYDDILLNLFGAEASSKRSSNHTKKSLSNINELFIHVPEDGKYDNITMTALHLGGTNKNKIGIIDSNKDRDPYMWFSNEYAVNEGCIRKGDTVTLTGTANGTFSFYVYCDHNLGYCTEQGKNGEVLCSHPSSGSPSCAKLKVDEDILNFISTRYFYLKDEGKMVVAFEDTLKLPGDDSYRDLVFLIKLPKKNYFNKYPIASDMEYLGVTCEFHKNLKPLPYNGTYVAIPPGSTYLRDEWKSINTLELQRFIDLHGHELEVGNCLASNEGDVICKTSSTSFETTQEGFFEHMTDQCISTEYPTIVMGPLDDSIPPLGPSNICRNVCVINKQTTIDGIRIEDAVLIIESKAELSGDRNITISGGDDSTIIISEGGELIINGGLIIYEFDEPQYKKLNKYEHKLATGNIEYKLEPTIDIYIKFDDKEATRDKKYKGKLKFQGESLFIIFNDGSVKWWLVTIIICSILIVAVIGFILLTLFNPTLRSKVLPYRNKN